MDKIIFEGLTKQRFLQEARTKPVICFGAGDLMKFVDRAIIRPNSLNVKYIVANSRKKQGQSYLGYEVYAPEKLLEEPAGSFIVLITTFYVYEVNEQLEEMGIKGAYPAALFTEDFMGESYREIQLNRGYEENRRKTQKRAIESSKSAAVMRPTEEGRDKGVTGKEFSTQSGPHFTRGWADLNEGLFQEAPLADISGIAERMGEDLKLAEMSPYQLSFLCGLLRQEKPVKVVEVGVAAGATTAVIVNCLNEPEMESKKVCLYSIDISTKYYRHPEHEAGYIAKKYDQDSRVHHEYLLGDVCAAFLDEICADGRGIDFLILDAAHVLPGEVLDFLVCLPYLNLGAVVVLHDVTLPLLVANGGDCFATGVLFSAVQGDKFYTPDPSNRNSFSNIAAFRVNMETKRHIRDVFFALSLRWIDFPGEYALASYRKVINQAYDRRLVDLFNRIVEQQKECLCTVKIPQHLGYSPEILQERWSGCERVYLYGTGHWGHLYYYWVRFHGLKLDGMIVSDDHEISELACAEFDVPVYHLSQIPDPSEACGVVLAMEGGNYENAYNNLLGTPLRILNDKAGR